MVPQKIANRLVSGTSPHSWQELRRVIEKKVFIITLVVVVVIEVDIFVAVLEELRRYDIFWVKSSSYFGLSRLHILG